MSGTLPAMPPRFAIGAALVFTVALPAYPADEGWLLRYRLVLQSGAGGAIAFDTAADGGVHAANVPPATTAAWGPGTYSWASWAELGSDVRDVDHGTVVLLPNVRTAAGPLDLRSEAEIALANVQALLRGRATQDALRYTINGRSLERFSVAELVTLEGKLRRDVERERFAATGRNTSRMVGRIGRA